MFYSEIHLNKLLKDLYFLKSHTLSGFVCILGISISDLKKNTENQLEHGCYLDALSHIDFTIDILFNTA